MIRVMIVEDDPMVASVNETYLSRLPGFCVIAKAADGLQALEKIKALSKATPYAGCAANAPVVIVPVYRKEGLSAPDFAQIDLSIAQENMWLETDAQGLGGVWIGIAPMEERMEEVHKLLELPKEVEVFSLFALGYPAESRAQEDRFHPERIHFLE